MAFVVKPGKIDHSWSGHFWSGPRRRWHRSLNCWELHGSHGPEAGWHGSPWHRSSGSGWLTSLVDGAEDSTSPGIHEEPDSLLVDTVTSSGSRGGQSNTASKLDRRYNG